MCLDAYRDQKRGLVVTCPMSVQGTKQVLLKSTNALNL